MITMGGNAELELVDSLDPFSEGIVFSVMPPKKSWKNIANLSGGEKVTRTKHSLKQMTDLIFFRLWAPWHLYLHFTISNLHLYMWWMRLMLHWISAMYRLLPTISQSEPRMHNLWSSVYETTCLSLLTGLLVFTRRIIVPRVLPSIHPCLLPCQQLLVHYHLHLPITTIAVSLLLLLRQ